jgi:diguanylate cyclase (GGDEF)-like protein/PAS domain S-box-containing protein
VLGHRHDKVIGTRLADLVHAEDRPALAGYFAQAVTKPGMTSTLKLRLRNSAGDYRHFEVVISNRMHDSSVSGFVCNMRDASHQRELEASLLALAAEREHDATHDALTGLANRRALFAHLETLIRDAASREFALLVIDLDGIKEINETLGHHAGDQLLSEIPGRLSGALTDASLFARFSGDEFAAVLPIGTGIGTAARIARDVLKALSTPFPFQGMALTVHASIGVVSYPEHAEDVGTLLRRADIATVAAKARGGGYETYSHTEDAHSRERLALIGELPRAIEEGELVLHYQPKFDVPGRTIAGVEALVRWEHPTRGLLGPGAFVALAEGAGLMSAMTRSILERALAQCATWQARGAKFGVAVNVGAANLLDVGFPDDVARLLCTYAIPPQDLTLEVTETIVGTDPVRIDAVLCALREIGVTLSLDDFGTGSSSLGFLRRLPVQEVKIDRSFVLELAANEQDAAIVGTIIALAHSLGLKTVAEGIETEAVYRRLVALHCDQIQGYLLGRPVPAEELLALAETSAAVRAAA